MDGGAVFGRKGKEECMDNNNGMVLLSRPNTSNNMNGKGKKESKREGNKRFYSLEEPVGVELSRTEQQIIITPFVSPSFCHSKIRIVIVWVAKKLLSMYSTARAHSLSFSHTFTHSEKEKYPYRCSL